jgi:hypothetical protein
VAGQARQRPCGSSNVTSLNRPVSDGNDRVIRITCGGPKTLAFAAIDRQGRTIGRMARLLMCVLTLGLTVAFLSCKSDDSEDKDGIHMDGGPMVSSSSTIIGDGFGPPEGGSGGTNSRLSLQGDGILPSGGSGGTRSSSTFSVHYGDGSSAPPVGGSGGTTTRSSFQGDAVFPTGGSAGSSSRSSSTMHSDGGMPPKGGSGGTSPSTLSIHYDGTATPVGGRAGSSSHSTIQGDGIYPPVGGRDAGVTDASTGASSR